MVEEMSRLEKVFKEEGTWLLNLINEVKLSKDKTEEKDLIFHAIAIYTLALSRGKLSLFQN
jgi:hypothetical protein